MAFQLRAASKKRTKLRMAISGVPGGGKTYTALRVAKHLIGEAYKLDDPEKSRIALIDTERSSAEFYADEFSFRHGNLPPEAWHPEKFTEALRVAEAACDVVILDSITHEWKWCLQQVDILKPKYKGNTWATWSEIRPPHDKFIDAIMSSAAHVICTMRSKMATEMLETGRGQKEVKQVGLETIQEGELDYAFHVVIDMARENHSASVRKSRIRIAGEQALDGRVFPCPGEAFAGLLVQCLESGTVEEAKKPAVPGEKKPAPEVGSGKRGEDRQPKPDGATMTTAETAQAAKTVTDATHLPELARIEVEVMGAVYELDLQKVNEIAKSAPNRTKGANDEVKTKLRALFTKAREDIAAGRDAATEANESDTVAP